MSRRKKIKVGWSIIKRGAGEIVSLGFYGISSEISVYSIVPQR
ncbi:MAG: hypothetical protein AABW41_05215 [Nanoarchaeota archaeon]